MLEYEYHQFFREHPLLLKYRFADRNNRPLNDLHYDWADSGWLNGCRMHPLLYHAFCWYGGRYFLGNSDEVPDMEFKVLNGDAHVLTARILMSHKQFRSGWQVADPGFRWATEVHQCLRDYEQQQLADSHVLELDK